MTNDPQKYDAAGLPLATLTGADPGNTDPEKLTAPLDPADNVYALINQDQGDQRETTPVGDDHPQ